MTGYSKGDDRMIQSCGNDYSFTQNRELSWLKFNERVLEEAEDPTVPLYERLKFVSIFTSNLDEFFMIRVGSLFDLSLMKKLHVDNKSGMTPGEQLKVIYDSMGALYRKRDRVYAEIEEQLRIQDIACLSMDELTASEKRIVETYYRQNIQPILSPQVVDPSHPFPHLQNKALTVAVLLRSSKKEDIGLIPLPAVLPRIVFLPGSGIRYVLTEKILLEYADDVFSMYNVTNKAIIAVTRNADVNPDDESYELEEDYRQRMKDVLKKRARLACVRLEIEGELCGKGKDFLMERLKIRKEQVFHSKAPLTMPYVFSLPDKLSLLQKRQLSYPDFQPQPPAMVKKGSMMEQVLRNDILLSYPYESMEPFLRLLKEASADPDVISIKITIYRLASKSRLVEYLSAAAENGKDVVVLMELRARFDEANNINWSENLEDAGCKVIYGIENFKVHSKICLITRRSKSRIQYITQIGTGNYNEKTCKLYTDFSMMTADPEIGSDAADFFKNMAVSNLDGNYSALLVAPHSLKPRLIALIDGQMIRAQAGKRAHILIKTNSVTDRDLIDKLAEASRAGVSVDLIVRGICCILPGIPGKTDRIHVMSVVGRFLEHSRVYCFLEDSDYRIYISSADLMTRNTSRRVEIACPVKNPALKSRIMGMMQVILADTVKGRKLTSAGAYAAVPAATLPAVSCQEQFMEEALKSSAEPLKEDAGGKHRLFSFFRRKSP